jgi:hypothetical protein
MDGTRGLEQSDISERTFSWVSARVATDELFRSLRAPPSKYQYVPNRHEFFCPAQHWHIVGSVLKDRTGSINVVKVDYQANI